jgi:glycosyltransferase involved in cell wall biosynthesis
MPEPELSVVVATHNRVGRLRALLAALREQSLGKEAFEVVVVDDASTDETGRALAEELERGELSLSVHRHPDNRGSGAARELGWRSARGRLIVFTDDDCVPEPAWLERALDTAVRNPGAVIQGRTEPIPGELEALPPHRRAFARSIRVVDFDAGFQTCNIVYPRELLERINGFDVAEYPRYPGEDADLGWRAVAAGAPAVYADEVRVHHAVNDLGARGKLRHAARWDMKFYVRHPQVRRAHFYRYGLFWKRTHLFLARAVLGLVLPARWPALRAMLARRYLRSLYGRTKAEGSGLVMAPYYLLYDLVEVARVVRDAIRYRRPMI